MMTEADLQKFAQNPGMVNNVGKAELNKYIKENFK